MSKLIDKLQIAAKGTPPPIGFGMSRKAATKTRLLLIAGLDPAALERAAVDGADAILVEPGKSHPTPKAIQKAMEAVSDVPWGAYLEENGDKKAGALVEAGCDFLVFPAGSRVADVPRDEKTGKILEVEPSMDDSLLRAINYLPVDAALLTDNIDGTGSLVWHHLMIFQHLANMLSKPLLVRVPANITEPELNALWDAGVDGVVAPAGAEAGALIKLNRIIDGLPARARQKGGKVEAVLPRAAGGGETRTPVPDEEEEEDE
jgi:hypothetical protein